MRRATEAFVKGFLRSRYGLATLLAIAVLAVLAAANLFTGGTDSSAPVVNGGAGSPPATTVNPTEGDDGVSELEPTVSTDTSDSVTVARAFAAAWLNSKATAEDWYAGLKPHATQELLRKLSGVDPSGVPAERITGEPTAVPQATTLVEVAFPVDSGVLRLRVVKVDSAWLVDGVDWGVA